MLVDSKAVQRHFQISRGTVGQWVRDGAPHYRHKHSLRFDLAELLQWSRAVPKASTLQPAALRAKPR